MGVARLISTLVCVVVMGGCGATEQVGDAHVDATPDVADTTTETDGADDSICDGYIGLATPEEVASTPREDPEAEYLALMLSDGLIAEQDAYDRVRSDIACIRANEPRVAHIRPYHLHDGRTLHLTPDDETMEEFRRSAYSEWPWDCMNELYVLEDILVHETYLELWFKGYYDLYELGHEYLDLPGMMFWGYPAVIGDGDSICVGQSGDMYHYVFDEASGDCPSGCTIHDFVYFTSEPGADPVFVDEAHADWTWPGPDWAIAYGYCNW